MGQVWRATDLLLSRPVAVKVLRPEYTDHPETLERFRQEAMHAGALSHPHVAQVYDYGPAGSGYAPYLVMEFVDGQSLADILVIDPVEPAFALDVVAQAADGLSAAHRAGLVHRDIKPGNLLISAEGVVKVTDFGIAHAAGQAPVTAPNLVMGTTQYMAPERIAGGPGTPASDVYALGIVLHECLTGEPPYEGAPADVMAAHLYVPLPPLPAGIPAEIDDLVARLTAKDPAQRIGDAREIAAIAAGLRDALAAGQLVPAAASASTWSAGTGEAGPETGHRNSGSLATALVPGPQYPDRQYPDSLAEPPAVDGGSSGASGAQPGGPGTSGPQPGARGGGGRTSGTWAIPGAGGGEPSDEWAVPPRMSLPASYGLDAVDPRQRRRRKAGAVALGAAVLAGAALGAVLVSGAFKASPAANPAPATSATGGAAPSGTAPGHKVSQVAPAGGGGGGTGRSSAAPTPGVTSPKPGKGSKKPSPSASASASGSASPSSSDSSSPSASPSGSPSSSPSSSPSASPSASPSSSPTPTPTPSTATTAPGSGCILVICL